MKQPKRMLAMLLVFAMLLTLCPSVFATNVSEYCSDVEDGKYYSDAIATVIERGIMYGTGEGKFSPKQSLTRGMTAAILYRYTDDDAFEKKGDAYFADVYASDYYDNATGWGYEKNITCGYGGKFYPSAAVTREDFACFLYRYYVNVGGEYAMPKAEAAADAETAEDWAEVKPYAQDAMKWAVETGIIRGVSATPLKLDPLAEITRADAAVMLVRFLTIAEGQLLTVYYTNDTHTYIDQPLSFSTVAQLKQDKVDAGENVLLVDAGDHVQGTAYGGLDQGKTIVQLMNAAGYDLATLGNHEFDYGMERALEILEDTEFPYISCNFTQDVDKDGTWEPVLDAYQMYDYDGVQIAFVGVTTPESFTKSTPKYFQDAEGNYIYGIEGGDDGALLYAAVQKAIDAALADGADYIIGLGHVGIDPSSSPWTSEEVIQNTAGFDAFIDGHSHSTVVGDKVADKNGDEVLLTQTGNYFNAIGEMTIDINGTITTKLITKADYAADAIPTDEAVKKISDDRIAAVDEELGTEIAESKIDFTINYADGKRAIRKTETNMGDLVADAYYWKADQAGLMPDVAICNGGGIRASVNAGTWTYKTCKTVNTFGNVLCVVEVTGQQLKDALEFGARFAQGTPDGQENGGFLHVSGCRYMIDPYIPNTVGVDEKNVWTNGPTTYRVSNIQVYNRETGTYEPLVLDKIYRVCGSNYTLYNCGDGFNMLDGGKHVLDGVSADYLAIADYVAAFDDTDDNGLADIATENSPLYGMTGFFASDAPNYEGTCCRIGFVVPF